MQFMRKICYLLFLLVGLFACNDKDEIVEVSKVALDKTEVEMFVGENITLKATVSPSNAINAELKWSSDNEYVAIVKDGVVAAVSEGSAVISAESANGVKASCSVTVLSNEEDRIDLEFEAYSTDAKLVGFENGLFRWTVTFADKAAYDSYRYSYTAGYLLVVDFYTSENNFAKGIPTGEFTLVNKTEGDADNKARVKRVNNATQIEEYITEGDIIVSKDGTNYSFVFDVNNGVYEYNGTATANTADSDLFKISNTAYFSTLNGDIDSNVMFSKAVYYFAATGPELYLGSEGIDITSNGFISGDGNVLQLYRNTGYQSYGKDEFKLEGTFPVDANNGPNVLEAGYKSTWGDYTFGSWYYELEGDNRMPVCAPISKGSITVELNEKKDHIKVSLQCQDDALPQSNNITVLYEGACLFLDPDQTGDFGSCTAGFFGPFEYPSPNMNWSVQLFSNEFKNTGGYYGGTGAVYMFDLLSTSTAKWNEGLTEGTYRMNVAEAYAPMSIQKAQVWNFVNGAYDPATDAVEIVDATFTVESMNDGSGRFTVTVDATDANGQKISGIYEGGVQVQNVATPPMANRVFNPENAEVTFLYMNEDLFGRSNWTVEMIEAGAKRENGFDASGLILSFNIYVPAGHTFEKGMPTGKFDLYQPELDERFGTEINGQGKYGISNDAYTLFHIVFQGDTGNARGWTDGSVSIEEKDGKYSVNIDMLSQAINNATGEIYRFTLTGDYYGDAILESFLNPSVSLSKFAPKAGDNKKDMRAFSKTGR